MSFDFNPNIRKFSFKNALILAEASELAYKSRAEYKKILKEKWGFSDIYPLDKNETQGFVAKKEDMILIAFRGTEETKNEDIFTDILACQTKTELGKVHYGFLRALKAVWKDVLTTVKNYQDNNQPVWITGHSLGGALAALASAKLASINACQKITGVYTFGQPRVGDKNFKENFERLLPGGTYRVANFKDPVTLVPLNINLKIWEKRLIFQYDHAGKIILFNEAGEIAESGDLVTRWVLIWVAVLGFVVALIVKMLRKMKLAEGLLKLFKNPATPHGLDQYKENIIKNLAHNR